MDPSSFFAQGNAEFVEERYKDALEAYNVATELAPDQATYFSARAAAQLKLGDFPSALKDSEAAVKLDPAYAMAHFRVGVASFYLGMFAEASAAFKRATSLPQSAMWIRKCDAELSGSVLPLKGMGSAAPAAPAPAPAAAPAPAPAPAAPVVPPSTKPADRTISGRKTVKHEWYQTPTHVFLTIFAKGVASDAVSLDHTGDEVIVSIVLAGSDKEEYQLHLDLFAAVETPEVSVSSMKVEVKMKKAVSANWGDLQKVVVVPQAAYPTSNRTKKDWNSIEKEAEAQLSAEKPEGDEALNKLFKEIYSNASEDTRRAMVKSFQTSGGSVLSTNWDDVSKADYEGKDRPSAPEGQAWADETKK